MEKITEIKVEQFDGSKLDYVIIDRGNGEYTSMPKSTYDEMIAAQSTPSVEQLTR